MPDGLPAGPVFPIDTVVNAADLVEITATTTPTSDPDVGLSFDTSADGMSRPTALVDARLPARCAFEPVSGTDSAVVCIPDNLLFAQSGYFDDDHCGGESLAMSRVSFGACHVPAQPTMPAVEGAADQACPEMPGLYAVVPAGPPQSGQTFTGCRPGLEPPAGASFYTQGERMPLISASRCPGSWTNRIRSVYLATADVHVRDGLYDTQLGVSCNVMATAGGALRCVPDGPHGTGAYYWADASYTVPLLAPYDVPLPAYAVDLDAAGVPTGYRTVGDEYTGPVFVADPAMGCRSLDRSGLTLYALSEPIEIATLPAATMVTD